MEEPNTKTCYKTPLHTTIQRIILYYFTQWICTAAEGGKCAEKRAVPETYHNLPLGNKSRWILMQM